MTEAQSKTVRRYVDALKEFESADRAMMRECGDVPLVELEAEKVAAAEQRFNELPGYY